MTKLSLSILKTLVYYDTFDWPLTGFEIWKYLAKIKDLRFKNKEVELGDVVRALEGRELAKFMAQKHGFYFLKDRQDDIVTRRIECEKLVDMKWRVLRRRAKWLGLIPYVRGVIVSGSMAVGNVRDQSDFDLLVITKQGRIWTARLLLTLFLDVFGWRRRGSLTKNKICLNHYVTEESLEVKLPSLYNAQTYAHAFPLLDQEGHFARFVHENQWITQYLHHGFGSHSVEFNQRSIRVPRLIQSVARVGEFMLSNALGDKFEEILRWLQRGKIRRNPKTYERGGRVAVSERSLEFHPSSKERIIIERFNARMRSLGFQKLATEKDSGLF